MFGFRLCAVVRWHPRAIPPVVRRERSVRRIVRILTVAAVTALAAVGMAPVAQAANRVVFTVWDSSGIEYYKQCSNVPPFTCGTFNGGMLTQITVANAPRNTPITVTYQIDGITATPGLDYTGPTTGTVTIPAGWGVGWTPTLPMVNDGVPEPNETVRVRILSSSVGGNISDTGIGTIYDGGPIPVDCDLFRPDSQSFSMTCSNRPATQRWKVEVECGEDWPMFVYVQGNIVTGNGTSSATCTGTGLPYIHWGYIVLP